MGVLKNHPCLRVRTAAPAFLCASYRFISLRALACCFEKVAINQQAARLCCWSPSQPPRSPLPRASCMPQGENEGMKRRLRELERSISCIKESSDLEEQQRR